METEETRAFGSKSRDRYHAGVEVRFVDRRKGIGNRFPNGIDSLTQHDK